MSDTPPRSHWVFFSSSNGDPSNRSFPTYALQNSFMSEDINYAPIVPTWPNAVPIPIDDASRPIHISAERCPCGLHSRKHKPYFTPKLEIVVQKAMINLSKIHPDFQSFHIQEIHAFIETHSNLLIPGKKKLKKPSISAALSKSKLFQRDEKRSYWIYTKPKLSRGLSNGRNVNNGSLVLRTQQQKEVELVEDLFVPPQQQCGFEADLSVKPQYNTTETVHFEQLVPFAIPIGDEVRDLLNFFQGANDMVSTTTTSSSNAMAISNMVNSTEENGFQGWIWEKPQ
eukprot:TRINITY_DN2500_c0_g1_i1.p1 TRINITY_DN2500_c0_g1~~TRINITY_DN2500_c0_g1_i1.p1  ORF type:complete len:284 (+),score=46.62 TRINITY_DN2500_c0_g1_i1:60-911(+)